MKLPANIPLSTQYDRISAYYNGVRGEEVLQVDDYAVLKRWETAHDLLLERRPTAKVVAMLVSKYGISPRLARKDIDHTRSLFAFTGIDRKAAATYLYEWGLELMNKAAALGDYKAARGFHSNLMIIAGLNRAESDLPPPEALTPQITIVYKPEDVKQRSKGDLDAMTRAYLEGTLDNETEDTDYEEA